MATEEQVAQKRGPWAKFMHWYESYQGKLIVNIIYSVGASVVIVGALFKILHWPGASQVLMLGMFTEAFLFLIGTLEKPHPEFHWENVFPQLLEYGTKPELLEEKSHQPRPTLLGAGMDGSATTPVSDAPVASRAAAPALNEGEMAALKDGIADLAKTASQLSELGKMATTTTQLGSKLAAAGDAAEKFVNSQDSLVAASAALGQQFSVAADKLGAGVENLSANYVSVGEEMQKVVAATKGYQQQVENVGTKITELNSIYELQINALQAQVEVCKTQNVSLNALSSNIDGMHAAAVEAQKSHEAFSAATSKLAKQIADLNQIYGNMLNALA